MSRSLLLLTALFVLSGCAYSIQGSPVAGPLPPGPNIAKPRKTANVDPCAMFTETDLKPVGTLKEKPSRKDGEIPNSCLYPLNENAYVVAAVPYRAFAESKEKQKDGREVKTSEHSTWLSCGKEGTDMVCTATIAVQRDVSLMVAIGARDATESKAAQALEQLARKALTRLPVAS